MDPVSAMATEIFVQAVKLMRESVPVTPSPMLRKLLQEVLELGVLISDRLDELELPTSP
jgi:hypothetical protein